MSSEKTKVLCRDLCLCIVCFEDFYGLPLKNVWDGQERKGGFWAMDMSLVVTHLSHNEPFWCRYCYTIFSKHPFFTVMQYNWQE